MNHTEWHKSKWNPPCGNDEKFKPSYARKGRTGDHHLQLGMAQMSSNSTPFECQLVKKTHKYFFQTKYKVDLKIRIKLEQAKKKILFTIPKNT